MNANSSTNKHSTMLCQQECYISEMVLQRNSIDPRQCTRNVLFYKIRNSARIRCWNRFAAAVSRLRFPRHPVVIPMSAHRSLLCSPAASDRHRVALQQNRVKISQRRHTPRTTLRYWKCHRYRRQVDFRWLGCSATPQRYSWVRGFVYGSAVSGRRCLERSCG